ncbi:MAG TPA: hypothetical protein VJP40_03520, partial [bacterium]|nr:hypothetical protein [bacterium]
LDQAFQFGRWFEDKDFWLGSFEEYRGVPPSSRVLIKKFDNQCVNIFTGDGVELNNCTSLGLDLTGLSFLPFTQASDLIFFDFPDLAP